jgi:hypothetical protein
MGNYAKPIKEVLDRLTYHCQEGQMLAGMVYYEKPEVKIDGLKDFPYVMVMIPTLKEASLGSSLAAGLKTIADAMLTVPLVVGVARDKKNSLVTLYEWCERVLDAIETRPDGSGTVDLNLTTTGSIKSATVDRNFALDLSLNAGITITVEPRKFYRGSRRT